MLDTYEKLEISNPIARIASTNAISSTIPNEMILTLFEREDEHFHFYLMLLKQHFNDIILRNICEFFKNNLQKPPKTKCQISKYSVFRNRRFGTKQEYFKA